MKRKTGNGGNKVMLVELGEEMDKVEIFEKRREIKRNWAVRKNEDLTNEKRRHRWRIRESEDEDRKRKECDSNR